MSRTPTSGHRAGAFVRQPQGFKAFIPRALPLQPELRADPAMLSLLETAMLHLGRLDSIATLVPDPRRFVYMYVRQEAVLSSQIEGTQTSLSELLAYEADQENSERTVDLGEVLNYVAALEKGLKLAEKWPISMRLLCEVHATLTKGVRGGESSKTPGEVRRSQNWIGGRGPDDAHFVPPPPHEVPNALSNFEKFLNGKKEMPTLIEIGLAHAQFETIHPFLDGNGRVGRLLITFLLAARGILSRPLLYLSHYLKQHRAEYYERLQQVRVADDWEGWIKYFLGAVGAVAEEASTRARRILELKETDHGAVRRKLKQRAGIALDLIDFLIQRPIVTSKLVQQALGKSQPTVDKLLRNMVDLGILVEPQKDRVWRKRFAYHRYLELFEADSSLQGSKRIP